MGSFDTNNDLRSQTVKNKLLGLRCQINESDSTLSAKKSSFTNRYYLLCCVIFKKLRRQKKKLQRHSSVLFSLFRDF